MVRKLRVNSSGRVDKGVPSLQERRDVGPPEAIDRLLRVTDEEQPPGIDRRFLPVLVAVVGDHRREHDRQVDLYRIRVLELVDQQSLISLPEPPPRGRAVLRITQQEPREHEQVVELQLARGAAFGDVIVGEPAIAAA